MKVGKPKSKRTPVRLRHKIEKASTAKQRKQRKEARKNPQWRSRLKKDPGIPNLYPYKEKLLNEIEQSKLQKDQDQKRRREEAKARREGTKQEVVATGDAEEGEDADLLDYEGLEESEGDDGDAMIEDDADISSANPMAALLASARQRAQDFSHTAHPDDDASDSSSDSWSDFEAQTSKPQQTTKTDRTTGASSSQSHTTAFNTLLSSSDILLHIVDARDPFTTRSPQIERQITSNPSKRLFLILNKIDLVPATTVKAWLKHLRQSLPTLPLLAASTTSTGFAREHAKAGLTPQTTTSALLHALKARSTATSTAQNTKVSGLTVGILGHPNTGKSTLINSLLSTTHQHQNKRSKTAAPTGAEAGVTTAFCSIKLDAKLRLLDAPGIVFPFDAPPNVSTGPTPSRIEREAQKTARLALLNALPSHMLTDPIPAVTLLLSRAAGTGDSANKLSQSLAETYNIPGGALSNATDRTNQFLIAVARARGRLGKGGVPNLSAAAKTVLGDWWAGRIKGGWVEVPGAGQAADGEGQEVADDGNPGSGDEKKVVAAWAEEFKLDGLWGDDAFAAADVSGGEVAMED